LQGSVDSTKRTLDEDGWIVDEKILSLNDKGRKRSKAHAGGAVTSSNQTVMIGR